MNKKTAIMAGAGVLALSTAILFGRNASISPAPDMPAEWFYHDTEEQAAPHRELIGKPAPKIETAKWFQGEVTTDSMKGKTVLLDLWATWCGPCKVAMPHTDELAKKYADKGLVVAAICSDGDEAFVPKFIAEKKLTVPMAWDKDAATFNAFKGQWYPTYVLIDKKGIVRAIGLTSDGVEKAIEKVLAE